MHTIHSGHAFGTFYEMIKKAKSHKMDMIAITDHGPSMKGSASEIYFKMSRRVPKSYKGMNILFGCETNLIDGRGNIDLDDKGIKKQDILLVGLHQGTDYKDLGKEKNTKALINCFNKYPFHIFVHPTSTYYDYDINKAVQTACDNNILIEINLTSLERMKINHPKEKGIKALKKVVDIVKKNKQKLIVNSDAHFLHELGDYSLLKGYWKELGLTKELIINNYPDELKKFIKSKDLKNYTKNVS